jgi:hypothetical protein
MHSLYRCAKTKLTSGSEFLNLPIVDLPHALIVTDTQAGKLNPKLYLRELTTKIKKHVYHSSSLFCLAQLSTVAKLNKMDSGYDQKVISAMATHPKASCRQTDRLQLRLSAPSRPAGQV